MKRVRVSIRAHTDAKLTQAQLEELATKLAGKRRELAAKLARWLLLSTLRGSHKG